MEPQERWCIIFSKSYQLIFLPWFPREVGKHVLIVGLPSSLALSMYVYIYFYNRMFEFGRSFWKPFYPNLLLKQGHLEYIDKAFILLNPEIDIYNCSWPSGKKALKYEPWRFMSTAQLFPADFLSTAHSWRVLMWLYFSSPLPGSDTYRSCHGSL